MKEADCIQFLQWALPQLHLRWEGFRKVHRRVCRRPRRRLVELQLAIADYRTFNDDRDPRHGYCSQAIERAGQGCYQTSSVKDLPSSWREQAFVSRESGECLKPEHRFQVTFEERDVRRTMPEGPFDMILCRYLVLRYIDDRLQQDLLTRMMERLRPGGAFVTGTTDALSPALARLEPWPGCKMVYRKP